MIGPTTITVGAAVPVRTSALLGALTSFAVVTIVATTFTLTRRIVRRTAFALRTLSATLIFRTAAAGTPEKDRLRLFSYGRFTRSRFGSNFRCDRRFASLFLRRWICIIP